jgi:hypothetical protein
MSRLDVELCNVQALFFRRSPDQGAIHADPLVAKGLVKVDGGKVEVVHEQRDGLPFPREMSAHLAKEGAGVAAAAKARIRPDSHELHDVVGDR